MNSSSPLHLYWLWESNDQPTPTLVRRIGLATTVFALTLLALMPVRTLGMELKVVGNQLILSGRVSALVATVVPIFTAPTCPVGIASPGFRPSRLRMPCTAASE